jgi:hypothetical protein
MVSLATRTGKFNGVPEISRPSRGLQYFLGKVNINVNLVQIFQITFFTTKQNQISGKGRIICLLIIVVHILVPQIKQPNAKILVLGLTRNTAGQGG